MRPKSSHVEASHSSSRAHLCSLKPVALLHGVAQVSRKLEIVWIESSDLEDPAISTEPGTSLEDQQTRHAEAWAALRSVDGIIVPGGFGSRGVEGKIATAKYARENKVPYLGICLGMQMLVVEYARTVGTAPLFSCMLTARFAPKSFLAPRIMVQGPQDSLERVRACGAQLVPLGIRQLPVSRRRSSGGARLIPRSSTRRRLIPRSSSCQRSTKPPWFVGPSFPCFHGLVLLHCPRLSR